MPGRTRPSSIVTLAAPAASVVTVDYATADGTAAAGSDYTAGAGRLTFSPGQTTATIAVPISGDTHPEGGETFTVTLSNPSGAVLGRAVATGTIIDDDTPDWYDFGTGSSPVAAGYTGVAHRRHVRGGHAGRHLRRDGDDRRPDLLPRDQMVVCLQGTQVDTITWLSPGQFAVRTYRTTVGADGRPTLRIADLGGDPYVVIAALRIDPVDEATGPREVSSSPTGDVDGPIDRVALAFSEPIRDGTFTLADVVGLTGPAGAMAPTAVNRVDATHYEVAFAPQSAGGSYGLTIGPNVLDLAGNPMDQNQDGVNGADPADRYAAAFMIAPPPPPPTIAPLPPPSSWRFDFGTATSPVAAGYTQVTPATRYGAAAGFGWLSGTVSGAGDCGAAAGTDLTRDLIYTHDATFAGDLPSGTYDVTYTALDPLYYSVTILRPFSMCV